MPNKRYNKGSQWERQIVAAYTKYGYTCMRSAGSHSPVDVIAFNAGILILIQAKSSEKEEFPDMTSLLKRTQKTKEKKRSLTFKNGMKYDLIKVSEEVPSNVVLMEEMPTPRPCRKIILWKGKGRKNYWCLEFNPETKRWSACRKPQII